MRFSRQKRREKSLFKDVNVFLKFKNGFFKVFYRFLKPFKPF